MSGCGIRGPVSCVVKDMISEVNEAVQGVAKENETNIETDRKDSVEASMPFLSLCL